MITKADLPLIQDLLCYLISNRSTCYEDFSSYIMWLLMACYAWSAIYLQLFNF